MSNESVEAIHKIGIEKEYDSLRAEILKRIELRQQMISITLTLAGVFLAVGITTEMVALIYPPLATFLAFGWAQNDFRIRELAKYIRERLETTMGLGYETYVQQERAKNKGLGAWRFVIISHSGIFFFTQFMAIGIEIAKDPTFVFTPLKWGLLAVDIAALLGVAWVTSQAKR